MLFIKKSIQDVLKETENNKDLKRTLTTKALIALGVGAVVGAGLFALTGLAAADYAGPAVSISFILAAICCAFAGLCYAEFASIIPSSGSAYVYTYATLGEFTAWIIGWTLTTEFALSAAAIASSWSGYFADLFHNLGLPFLPESLLHTPFDDKPGIMNLPAVLIVVVMSLVLIRGTQSGAIMNNFLVILKIAILVLFIAIGANYIKAENLTPYIVENTGNFGEFGTSGILRGASVVFFAFLGFDSIATAAQETKNPKKAIPMGIIGSLIICAIIYIIFSFVLTGVAHYSEYKGDTKPIATAISHFGTSYSWLQNTINIAIIAGFTSGIMITLLAQSRIYYSMSKDGLLPKVFSEIHPNYNTPYKNNIILMVFVSIFAGLIPLGTIANIASIGTLLVFAIVCAGIIILRKTMPNIERPFKVPFGLVIPVLGTITCVGLMLVQPLNIWGIFITFLVIGVVIYFLYSYKHSKLRKKQK